VGIDMKKKLFITFFDSFSKGLLSGIVADNYDELLERNIAIYDHILEIEYDTDDIRRITVAEKNHNFTVNRKNKIAELKKELEELENDDPTNSTL
jgi:hypothetical protein